MRYRRCRNWQRRSCFPCICPWTHDREELERNHEKAAETVISVLEQGKHVIFLTLGDPVIYSTFSYVQKRVEKRGYKTGIVSGITSFCAAGSQTEYPSGGVE